MNNVIFNLSIVFQWKGGEDIIKYSAKKRELLVALAEKCYTQSKLSEVTNLDKSTISTFINNKRNVSGNTVKKIAEALDREVNEITHIISFEGGEVVDASSSGQCGIGSKQD